MKNHPKVVNAIPLFMYFPFHNDENYKLNLMRLYKSALQRISELRTVYSHQYIKGSWKTGPYSATRLLELHSSIIVSYAGPSDACTTLE